MCTPPGRSRECGQAEEMGAVGVTLEKSERVYEALSKKETKNECYLKKKCSKIWTLQIIEIIID